MTIERRQILPGTGGKGRWPGGDGQEVVAVRVVNGSSIDETQVGLVHQGRRLQRVVRTLRTHQALGTSVELLVDDGDDCAQSAPVTIRHFFEQPGYVSDLSSGRFSQTGSLDLGQPDWEPLPGQGRSRGKALIGARAATVAAVAARCTRTQTRQTRIDTDGSKLKKSIVVRA